VEDRVQLGREAFKTNSSLA